jgi:hypothetical protein
MNYLLLDLAAFPVGTDGLVVGAVLLTVPLDVDGSYVDGGLRGSIYIEYYNPLPASGVAFNTYS